MSLSGRDKFVRYLDPQRIVWEDADGNVHFSIPNALAAFDLEDTPEHRAAVTQIMAQQLKQAGAGEIVYRPAPDTEDYWKQVHPDNRPPEFRHLPYEDPT
jgi:hypothetical protein